MVNFQPAPTRLGYGCNFCFCTSEIGVGLKKNIGDTDAVVCLADDIRDTLHRRRHYAFEAKSDTARHIQRQHAGISPDHGDNRNFDSGKNVCLGFPRFHGHIVKHIVDFQIVPD